VAAPLDVRVCLNGPAQRRVAGPKRYFDPAVCRRLFFAGTRTGTGSDSDPCTMRPAAIAPPSINTPITTIIYSSIDCPAAHPNRIRFRVTI
jgi:hypothetical protein